MFDANNGPSYRLIRNGMWIVGTVVFSGMLFWAVISGFAVSDAAWKAISSISLAALAAGVPAILAYMKASRDESRAADAKHGVTLDRVEKHTNSLVQKLVDDARDEGLEEGRRKEVRRAEREDDREDDDATPTITLEELEGKEVTLEGTLTEKDEADKEKREGK